VEIEILIFILPADAAAKMERKANSPRMIKRCVTEQIRRMVTKWASHLSLLKFILDFFYAAGAVCKLKLV